MARQNSRVTIEGIDRLRDRLAELEPTILAAAKRAVRDSATAVREDTRRGVRVDTGNLRDKVAVHIEDDGLRAEVGWRDRHDWYAALHEHGTRRIPAQPALGPAIEAERTKLADRIRTEIRRDLP
ncbi:HK97-gp10 family putative phage morphogenesis protein [Streptomyces sp. NRRL F-5135]|uniref:HK97-gp10 family putative phage morphogenesis protein n=1 Tax=Streptomyces sp. NRRL F-5135 TaxID=1463858 RepID=UPI0004C89F7F|nr:HK97-gp10 family putative phage morphogenesis protein [Streptomyces sp. NRRL F-5135]